MHGGWGLSRESAVFVFFFLTMSFSFSFFFPSLLLFFARRDDLCEERFRKLI